jgi:hypothetical protein
MSIPKRLQTPRSLYLERRVKNIAKENDGTLGSTTVAASQMPEFKGFDIYEVEAIVHEMLAP